MTTDGYKDSCGHYRGVCHLTGGATVAVRRRPEEIRRGYFPRVYGGVQISYDLVLTLDALGTGQQSGQDTFMLPVLFGIEPRGFAGKTVPPADFELAASVRSALRAQPRTLRTGLVQKRF